MRYISFRPSLVPTRLRVVAGAAVLSLIAGVTFSSGPASADPLDPDPPGPPPGGVIFDVDAKAVVDWSLPKRYQTAGPPTSSRPAPTTSSS